MKTAIQRREMIRRITAIVSELGRIRLRMEKLEMIDRAKPGKPADAKSKAKSSKGAKVSKARKSGESSLVGQRFTYRGTQVKVVEVKGSEVKAKFLANPKTGKGKKGGIAKIHRAYAYRLVAA